MATLSAGSPTPEWVLSQGLFDSEIAYLDYLQEVDAKSRQGNGLYQPIWTKKSWIPPDGVDFDHHSGRARLSVYLGNDDDHEYDGKRTAPLAWDSFGLTPPSMGLPASIMAVPEKPALPDVIMTEPFTTNSRIWWDAERTPADELAKMVNALVPLNALRDDELQETLDVIHFNSSLWVLDPDTSPILSLESTTQERMKQSGYSPWQWFEWYRAQNVICQMQQGSPERRRAENLLKGWSGSAWDLFAAVRHHQQSHHDLPREPDRMLEVLVHCAEPLPESDFDEE